MSYAGLEDLQAELGDWYARLSDRVNGEEADDDAGQEALDASSAEMDGYLAGRYVVPVEASGDAALAALLKVHCLNLAVHRMWLRSLFRRREPQTSKIEHDKTMAWLIAVRDGKAELPGDVPGKTGRARVVGEPRVFSSRSLRGH